eukprot:TRINITY_DN469_c0_g1_i1.p1 TRINITY_DN469_c0_g1~~TRINITY_DN469_c0_g1_i1.p1  ORF type:complete len:195 (-),score=32.95 TRINITY_DN469_c0_g1_i1:117-701(-)
MDKIEPYLKQIDNTLDRVAPQLQQLQAKTGVRRSFIAVGLAVLFVLIIAFAPGGLLLANLVAFGYPAFASLNTLASWESGSVTGAINRASRSGADAGRWVLTYWLVFSFITINENALSFIPFYPILKLVFFLWLALPATMGAEVVYAAAIRPLVQKFGNSKGAVDAHVEKATQAAHNAVDEGINKLSQKIKKED